MPPYQNNNQLVGPPSNTGPVMSSNKTRVGLVIGLLVISLLLIVTMIFAFWSYKQMKDYKNNTDQKVSAAIKTANAVQKQQLETQFADQQKSPLKTYSGPSQYGSIKISYPKTWSAYIIEQINNTNLPVDAYCYPDFVPGVSLNNINYSLRFQIVGDSYNSVLNQYSSSISKGTLRATPYIPDQVKGATVGVRLDGQLGQNKNGSMIILSVRDKVLKIWTEDNTKIDDFNNYILKNLSYLP